MRNCGRSDLEDCIAHLPSSAGRNSHNEPRLLKFPAAVFRLGLLIFRHRGGRRSRYHLAILEPVDLRDPVGEEVYGMSTP